MVDPGRIIQELNQAEVEYVIIGGVAATLHGCPEQTYDLDMRSGSRAKRQIGTGNVILWREIWSR